MLSMAKPDFPSTSVPPTLNGNAYEAEVEACRWTLDIINEGNKMNRAHPFEIKDEGTKAPCSYTGHIIRQSAAYGAQHLVTATFVQTK